MKIGLYDLKGQKLEEIKLPKQFEEVLRKDLIKRAVLAIESNNRQPYGASPLAGKDVSAKLSRERHTYKTSYGLGISRVPRKILSRRGSRMNWVGAQAPGTVGGRQAHPPKAEKIYDTKLNVKENRFAIRSAMSASVDSKVVKARGHKVPAGFPFGLTTDFESISKSTDLKKLLVQLGFSEEIERASEKKVRAGKGKMRGRPYKEKKSILFVVSKSCDLVKAAANMSGVDVIEVKKLNAAVLAPGTHAGRLTLYTKGALDELEKSGLFLK